MHSPQTDHEGRPVPGVVLLDADEHVLGLAYATLLPIIDRLMVCPFDQVAYTAMGDYLTGMGGEAAEAFARVAGRGEYELAARAAVITSATVVRPARRGDGERT